MKKLVELEIATHGVHTPRERPKLRKLAAALQNLCVHIGESQGIFPLDTADLPRNRETPTLMAMLELLGIAQFQSSGRKGSACFSVNTNHLREIETTAVATIQKLMEKHT